MLIKTMILCSDQGIDQGRTDLLWVHPLPVSIGSHRSDGRAISEISVAGLGPTRQLLTQLRFIAQGLIFEEGGDVACGCAGSDGGEKDENGD